MQCNTLSREKKAREVPSLAAVTDFSVYVHTHHLLHLSLRGSTEADVSTQLVQHQSSVIESLALCLLSDVELKVSRLTTPMYRGACPLTPSCFPYSREVNSISSSNESLRGQGQLSHGSDSLARKLEVL